MGGVPCTIIIDGNGVQGASYELITTAQASCQLVEYLVLDPDDHFNDDDGIPIRDFHIRAQKVIHRLAKELDAINRALAAKYSREVA